MARRVRDVVIEAEGRDTNKVFRLTEMPASIAERWAIKFFIALAHSGIDVPDDIAQSGMAGVAAFGVKALSALNYDDVAPLLDEMFEYITVVPDSRKDFARRLVEDDTEEVLTRIYLRKEMFFLHTNFSLPVEPSN